MVFKIGHMVKVCELVELIEKKFFIDEDGDLCDPSGEIVIFEEELQYCGKNLYVCEIRKVYTETKKGENVIKTYCLEDENGEMKLYDIEESVFKNIISSEKI